MEVLYTISYVFISGQVHYFIGLHSLTLRPTLLSPDAISIVQGWVRAEGSLAHPACDWRANPHQRYTGIRSSPGHCQGNEFARPAPASCWTWICNSCITSHSLGTTISPSHCHPIPQSSSTSIATSIATWSAGGRGPQHTHHWQRHGPETQPMRRARVGVIVCFTCHRKSQNK